MRILSTALLLLAAVAPHARGADLPRSNPEKQGVSSPGVRAFVEAAESPHMLFSLSKSFTSTAVGIAANDGKFESITLEAKKDGASPRVHPKTPVSNLCAEILDRMGAKTAKFGENMTSQHRCYDGKLPELV